MVTNRKKLKSKKRKAKLIALIAIVIMLIISFSVYSINKTLHTKAKFISPLSKNNTADSSVQNDKNVQFISDQLTNKKIEFAAINISSDNYIIKLKDGSEVILSTKKDLAKQISSLQFILSRLTMEGKQFNKLDLQFDNPIIIFK